MSKVPQPLSSSSCIQRKNYSSDASSQVYTDHVCDLKPRDLQPSTSPKCSVTSAMRICFDSELPKNRIENLGVMSDHRLCFKEREDFEAGFSLLLVFSFATPHGLAPGPMHTEIIRMSG